MILKSFAILDISQYFNLLLMSKKCFFNRELSFLAFVERVLNQSNNINFPILERVRYLSFVSIHLDEFFEIRVAGLIQQVDSNVIVKSIDGLTPKEQLKKIVTKAKKIVDDQYQCFQKTLIPELRSSGVIFKKEKTLTKEEKIWLSDYFEEQIFPILTPLAIDPAHPFPQLTNKSLYTMVGLKDPENMENKIMMAVVPVPRILARVIPIEVGPFNSYIFLSEVIRIFAKRLFPGYEIRGTWDFRITRNSDLYFDEEEAENLLRKIEEELRKIRRGTAVRLEIRSDVPDDLLNELVRATHLHHNYVFKVEGPVNLKRLLGLYDTLKRPDLKFPPFQPHVPANLLNKEAIFDSIAREDILLHHPYDSFTPVVDFIETAAKDPTVFAIKQTLYRTSGDSPVVEALKVASQYGKQVTALIELKARFEEAINIEWAKQLEEAGVHVVYGLVGLKTHCKCCLIVRKEPNGLKRYVHLGTGNYNPGTAKSYTDLSLLTADPDITEEVANLFNALTGLAKPPQFNKLLVSPFNLHAQIQAFIKEEIKNAKAGKPARIIAKVNSIADKETIENLYLASQAGVDIHLIVRSISCLCPKIKGLSDNIQVSSLLGHYLEHSRIYYFENATQSHPRIYLSSADWMPRNFYRRIEVAFPIENASLRKRLTEEILPAYLKDNVDAEILATDGTYHPQKTKSKTHFCAQEYFIECANKLRAKQEESLAQYK